MNIPRLAALERAQPRYSVPITYPWRSSGTFWMSAHKVVFQEINLVAVDHNKRLASFDEDSLLFSFGLDSLCFTVLVLRLKGRFGVDLFDVSEQADLPMTVGDLVRFYERRLVADDQSRLHKCP